MKKHCRERSLRRALQRQLLKGLASVALPLSSAALLLPPAISYGESLPESARLAALDDVTGQGEPTSVPVGVTTTLPGTAKPAQGSEQTSDTTEATAGEPSWPDCSLTTQGLYALGMKEAMQTLNLRVYGFVESGFTGRLTGGQRTLPMRGFEARWPNNIRLHQLRLTVDRPYDSSKAFDIGGRVDGLFGGDALLTHSPGLFFNAGEGTRDMWADMLQAYGQVWLKTGDESGLETTVGKFVTPIGLEVIDAPGNALFSHSYLFSFAIPFTHTGVKTNYVINKQASIYAAIVEGWEVFNDNNNAHSYMVGGALAGKEQIDGHARDQFFWNVITGPEEPDNSRDFRTVLDGTYTHWWTNKLSQSINADYGAEGNVAGIGQARWYGAAHYLTYTFNEYVQSTWRTEWFRDDGGFRTGADASYYENTLGLNITPFPNDKVFKNLTLRPELRWDAADEPVFGGSRENQLTAGFDVIFKF